MLGVMQHAKPLTQVASKISFCLRFGGKFAFLWVSETCNYVKLHAQHRTLAVDYLHSRLALNPFTLRAKRSPFSVLLFFFCFRSIKIISTVAVGSMQLLGLLNNNTIVIYKSFIIFSCFAAHLSRSFIGQERRASLLFNLIKNFSDESLRNCNYLKNDLKPPTINRCTF